MALQTIIEHRVSILERVGVLMQAYLENGVHIIAAINDSTGYYVYGMIGMNQDKREVEAKIRAYMDKEEG